MLGPDGQMTLLEMIAEGKLPTEEVLDVFKRLYIPGYEHARFYFKDALAEGVIEPDVAPGYYRQEAIEATLKFAAEMNAAAASEDGSANNPSST